MIKWLCRITPSQLKKDALHQAKVDLHVAEMKLEHNRFATRCSEEHRDMLLARVNRLEQAVEE
jgi:hypothetical protein